jgi:hypothetical protein
LKKKIVFPGKFALKNDKTDQLFLFFEIFPDEIGSVIQIIFSQMKSMPLPLEVHGQKLVNSSNTNPLIVLDGVIYMGDPTLTPATVESMSILKDEN